VLAAQVSKSSTTMSSAGIVDGLLVEQALDMLDLALPAPNSREQPRKGRGHRPPGRPRRRRYST
jgi:hypothetical protein